MIVTYSQAPAINAPLPEPSGTTPSTPSIGVLADGFVESGVESLSPFYLTECQKRMGSGVIDLPSFCLNPTLLTERLLEQVSPTYRLLTMLAPEVRVTRLHTWLPQAVTRTVAAGIEVIHSSASRLCPIKTTARLVPPVCPNRCQLAAGFLGLLIGLPQQTLAAKTIEVNSSYTLSRIGRDENLPLDGVYQQTADINAVDVPSIGSPKKPFTGIYDGNGYVIDGLQNCLFLEMGETAEVHGGIFRNATVVRLNGKPAAVIACYMTDSSSLRDHLIEFSTVLSHGNPAWEISIAGIAFGDTESRNYSRHQLNRITNITIRYSISVANGFHSAAGVVGGFSENTIIEDTLAECCQVFVNGSVSEAAVVVGWVGTHTSIANTTAISCLTQGSTHGNQNSTTHGSELDAVGIIGYTDGTAEISDTTLCNVTVEDTLINEGCSVNNSTNASCPADTMPDFPKINLPTPEQVTEATPESTPVMPPVGIIAAASIVTLGVSGLVTYMGASYLWGYFCKGLRGTELCCLPVTNARRILRGLCRDTSSRASSRQDPDGQVTYRRFDELLPEESLGGADGE